MAKSKRSGKSVVFRRVNRGGRSRVVPIVIKNRSQTTIGAAKLATGSAFAIIGGFEAGQLSRKSARSLFVGKTNLASLKRKAGSPLRRFAQKQARRIITTGKFTRALSRRTLGLSVIAGTLGVKEGVENIRRGMGQTNNQISSDFFQDLTVATVLGGTLTTAAFLKGSGRKFPSRTVVRSVKAGAKFTKRKLKNLGASLK